MAGIIFKFSFVKYDCYENETNYFETVNCNGKVMIYIFVWDSATVPLDILVYVKEGEQADTEIVYSPPTTSFPLSNLWNDSHVLFGQIKKKIIIYASSSTNMYK